MKKIIMCLISIIMVLITCSCKIENKSSTIYTTNYPITFITTYLYGNTDNIKSIYPNDISIDEYNLSKKAISEYSRGNIFIYNGLSSEKEYAKKLINTNHNLNIIDAGENLRYDYSIKETWLSPNNCLMLAKNIKNHLIELSTSQDEIKTINENFKTLEQELSGMDAYLRSIATSATKEPTIIAATSEFKYLQDYGFDVIALDENISDNNLATIKASFNGKKYESILAFNGYENTELVNALINDNGAKIVNVNPIYSITNDDVLKNETYISLMNNYIETIRNIVIK